MKRGEELAVMASCLCCRKPVRGNARMSAISNYYATAAPTLSPLQRCAIISVDIWSTRDRATTEAREVSGIFDNFFSYSARVFSMWTHLSVDRPTQPKILLYE